MPVHKVKGGYKWGSHGKTYPDKASAVKQGQAAHANGYKGDSKNIVDAIKQVKQKMQDPEECGPDSDDPGSEGGYYGR